MKTGAHLKIRDFGSNAQGVQLFGDPKRPEHDEFRVVFPGGSVSVTRTTDGDYWVHTQVDHPESTHRYNGDGLQDGFIVDGRVDVLDKHASETSCGDLDNHKAYHVAVRVSARKG